MHAALLSDRGLVRIDGDDSIKFLNGLLTVDIAQLQPGAARYAALLTPQGKIIVDGLVVRPTDEDGGGYFFDCPRALARTLADRLGFYKLRAKVEIADRSDTLAVMALWDGAGGCNDGLCYGDPRLPALGQRVILPPGMAATAAAGLGVELGTADAYEAHRIALGVPKGGVDFIYGDAFPHEADMDQLRGLDFKKGCYIGQEVVSRVEHRGTARSRIVPVSFVGGAPETGLPVTAGDKQIGVMGSAAGGRGLALLRLDRLQELGPDAPISAGGVTLTVHRPGWAKFDVPRAKDGG